MDIDDHMEFDPEAPDGGPPGPPGAGPPIVPLGGGQPSGSPRRVPTDRGPPEGAPGGDPPDVLPGAGIPADMWRWIVYLKRRFWKLEHEAKINKIDIGKSAAVASKNQKELDIAKFEARKLSGVVTKLQRRLDRPEDLRSHGSDRPPPLASGSADSWGPGPRPDRSCCPNKAPRSDHAPSTRGIAERNSGMNG